MKPDDIPQWAKDEAERLRIEAHLDWREGESSIARAILAARNTAYEDAAKVIDAECERILALQDGREPQVDQNLRMVVALLPDLAAAIRAKASQKGEKP